MSKRFLPSRAEKMDGYSKCQWCAGRGCTFCPGEEKKDALRREEYAFRIWSQSGFYKSPDFEMWHWGEVVLFTFENDQINECRDCRDIEIIKVENFAM